MWLDAYQEQYSVVRKVSTGPDGIAWRKIRMEMLEDFTFADKITCEALDWNPHGGIRGKGRPKATWKRVAFEKAAAAGT